MLKLFSDAILKSTSVFKLQILQFFSGWKVSVFWVYLVVENIHIYVCIDMYMCVSVCKC